MYGVRQGSSFIPLHVAFQCSQHHLLETLSFSPLYILGFFFFFNFIYWFERERKGEGEAGWEGGGRGRDWLTDCLICCFTYLYIHWLILLCAPTRIKPTTLVHWDNTLTNWATWERFLAHFAVSFLMSKCESLNIVSVFQNCFSYSVWILGPASQFLQVS